jgi:NAD(P)-dependent dehydrogenase (short-subunit alcohol dehydrogenase family)
MELGKLNGAVNSAGVINETIGKPESGIEVLNQNEWDFCIGINLTGIMQCCGLKYCCLRMMAVPLLMQQAHWVL